MATGQLFLVAPLFALLAALILSMPIVAIIRYIDARNDEKALLASQRLPTQRPGPHQRRCPTHPQISTATPAESFELKPIEPPPKAKVKQIVNLLPAKPLSNFEPPTQLNANHLDRSNTTKTYSSTASTIVSPRARAESILTAKSGPLPTIMPGKDGFFTAPEPVEDHKQQQKKTSRGKSGTRSLTREYQLDREKSRKAKFRDNLSVAEGKSVDLEGMFDDVDLHAGEDGMKTRGFA